MNDLTVFVISSGNNPNFTACLEALENQSVKFKIEIIKDYKPMSVAFQEMLNRCKTEYYIEVDEDMILDRNAVNEMYVSIKSSDSKTSMIGFQLLDVHLDFIIYGVKIYKYNIFKNYPYSLETISCEIDQLSKLQKDGYTYALIEKVVGKHNLFWNDDLIFERYFNLMEKYKDFKYIWIEKLPMKLWEILQRSPTKQNLYALLGIYTSLIKQEKIIQGEKDFTNIRSIEKERMESFLSFPNTSTLYLTTKCNFKCSFCKRQHQELKQHPDMTVNIIRDILVKFPTIQSFCLCGFGEPLLCDNLKSILQFLTQRRIFKGLITNGSLLKDKINDIKPFIPDYISISLNSSNEEQHYAINGQRCFNQILKGIELLINEKAIVYLSYVCTKNTMSKIPEFLKLAKFLGVTGVHLHNLLPHKNDDDFWNLALTKNDQNLIDQIKRDVNSSIVLRYPILIEKNVIRRECRFPWRMLSFDGDGNISICPSICEPQKENGNLYDFDIWHNKYSNDLRNSILTDQKPYCKKCFRNWEVE